MASKRLLAVAVVMLALLGALSLAEAEDFDCASYDGTQIYNNISRCPHVAHLDGLRLAVKYDPALPSEHLTMLAEVFASWSAGNIDVVIVGPTDPINCATDGDRNQSNDPWVEPNVTHWCIQHWETDSTVAMGYYPTTIFDVYPYRHQSGGRMFIPVTHPNSAFNYRGVMCHEFGHYLGVNHGAGGCMASTSDCPGQALGYLDLLYAHNDGFQPHQQAGPPAIVGIDRCSGGTPTPTASPTPTVTATSTPTPTPCWPPRSQRCR